MRVLLIATSLLVVTSFFLLNNSVYSQDVSDENSEVLAEDIEIGDSQSQSKSNAYPLTDERRTQLSDYAAIKNQWRFVSLFVSLSAFLGLCFSGLSARFRNWSKVVSSKFLSVWIYYTLVMIAFYLFSLPFSIYRSFVIEHQFGFSNQSFMQWWGEDIMSLLIIILIGILPVWFFYRLVNEGKQWWLKFSLGSIPFMIFFIVIAPIFIAPLFNKYSPLEEGKLRGYIYTLASNAGIGEANIFEVNASKQSTKINAYVTGLFNTRRIVLYDNLVNNFTSGEIMFVMGHEMGHYIENHLWWGLLLTFFLVLFSVWLIDRTIRSVIRRFSKKFRFDSFGDVASLPLVVVFIVIISFFTSPIQAGVSRYLEHRSDIFGMNVSGVSGDVAATAFEKLSAYNLSDPDPHPLIEFWFYSHPSIKKRVNFVRNYEKSSK